MDHIQETLETPDGWTHEGNELVRVIDTATYAQGVELTLQIANLADAMNHHPEIALTYSQVRISVSSHDVGAVTGRDIVFAHAANTLISEI